MNLPNRVPQRPPKRRILLWLINMAIIELSYLFVWIAELRTGHNTTPSYIIALAGLLVGAIYTVIFGICRVDRTIWRYSGSADFLRILAVSCLAGSVSCFILTLAAPLPIADFTHMAGALIAASLLTLSRVWCQASAAGRNIAAPVPNARRLLIVGAGSAGSRLVEEILASPSCGLMPIGFADDDPQKQGRAIAGIRVLGRISELEAICASNSPDIIYIAIPSADNARRAEILDECSKTSCTVRILPLYTEIAGNTEQLIAHMREITAEELLGREPIRIADEQILSFVKGKTVVITGGGGSIGSELCRQIAANSPRRIVIADLYENNAYTIQQELIARHGSELDLAVRILNVCHTDKLLRLFAEEKPDIVIHAAAYKHVPLMEDSPDEAVRNNVFGTLSAVKAAREAGVGRFVLISTDKAVNPTNIYGATKRVCEMIVQHAASIPSDTTFTAVRFGNVLGSNGSVIPLFRQQIENRRDLTVTHPEMIRYFMTIPEASQLVLTASAMAKGGEIFVLDMGSPVKIDDLAKKMIQLAGLTLGRDINIRYIGLRPGEKLYEELLMSEEGLRRTQNNKIFIGRAIGMDADIFLRQLSELEMLVSDPDTPRAALEAKLMEIVPTFRRVPAAQPDERAGT